MKRKVVGLLLGAMLATSSMGAFAQEPIQTEDGEQVVQVLDVIEGKADAKKLTTNTTKTDKLLSENAQNWYYVDITKKGYVTVSFGKTDESSDPLDGWKISVMNSDNTITYASKEFIDNEQYNSCKLGLEPGRYYIKVADQDSRWSAKNVNYDLKVTEVADAYWESEPNDVRVKADVISVNKDYKGNLYKDNDADWYQVNVTEKGYVKLHLNPDDEADEESIRDGWRITLYQDGQTEEYCSYDYIKRGFVSAEYPIAPGKYYIKVNATGSSFAPKGVDYVLKVENVAATNWEVEDNDMKAKANTIDVKKEYKGNFKNGGDNDWFKFTLPKANTVNLGWFTKYCVDDEGIRDGWHIELYDAKGVDPLQMTEGIRGDLKTANIKLDKGSYYVKIQNQSSFWGVDIRNAYAFKVNAALLNCDWIDANGKSYWYENGDRQGTLNDPNGVIGDGTVRGREIYDGKSDGWYWLDAIYEGAKATDKEVWMPYIYQGESEWDETAIWNAANLSGYMNLQVYNAIKSHTGKWVRYDENGRMYKGWYTVSDYSDIYPDQRGNTYYYDPQTGLMAKGWTLIDNKWCYFDEITGVYNRDLTLEE